MLTLKLHENLVVRGAGNIYKNWGVHGAGLHPLSMHVSSCKGNAISRILTSLQEHLHISEHLKTIIGNMGCFHSLAMFKFHEQK